MKIRNITIFGTDNPRNLHKLTTEKVKASYQALMETPEYSLDTDRQAQLVRPLYFGLLNETQTAFAKKRLIQALANYGWRLGTGFLSTPLILDVLETIDIEAAYRLLENEQMPGWYTRAFMVWLRANGKRIRHQANISIKWKYRPIRRRK